MTLRPALATTLALALTVTLAGCIAPAAPTPEPEVSDGLAPFFEQGVDWTECGEGVDCATIVAPLDWEHPAMGSIELAVSRIAATGTARGSLLVNPGGPGGSGFDFVRDSIRYVASADLMEEFDLVGWDPRGVGRSSAVECLDGAAMDELLFGQWDNAYETKAWVTELEAAEAEYAAACARNTGPLLEFVDSGSTARDMNLLRALLGDEKLNYLGFSYGTFFGTMFAELFPERVGRLVLDGALDPSIGALDWFAVQMKGFDDALVAYLAFCVGQGNCPLGGTEAAARSTFTNLLDTVDAKGIESADGRALDSATLGFAIAAALYSEENWPALTSMFEEVAVGESFIAFQFADSYYGRGGTAEYDNNSFDVYTATLCLDDDFQGDEYDVRSGLDAIDAAAPLVGGYFAFDDYAHVEAACTAWPYAPKKQPGMYDAAGADPILVIGTTNDPATPYAWAKSLAGQLESGVLVTFNGEGHTAYGRSNGCIVETVDAYFIDGTVPTSDPNC
ncbi:alpha/beta hydrolase [Glaciihabitans arcticus]|uniref:Alpha/beta hydrolase n=1 Tax=Glaciihabitans arcticus TaxID=2668039 RepID=A0A4Q9GVX9_9MICO|nr:alpha/beta hydrolase [Glaciihabitans arcticus]TBN57758.1 alpha/beta hydrolase [Glaciihabitans arcticus]